MGRKSFASEAKNSPDDFLKILMLICDLFCGTKCRFLLKILSNDPSYLDGDLAIDPLSRLEKVEAFPEIYSCECPTCNRRRAFGSKMGF
jgi:hypothetical protein